ncbi:MAG: DpnD/PcfM family protein [Gallionella sp.]|nr:DpnD/PcfM family protein [Gallionella sp.]
MKTFEIKIKETLSKIIEIEANSIENAIEKATLLYKHEEIILSSDDYFDTEIGRSTSSN